MPVLPDKYALGATPDVANRGVATLDAPKGTGVGMVAGQLAESAKKLAETVQAKWDEADNYELQKSVVEFDLEQEKRLDDAQRETAPAAKDFTTNYRAGYDAAARQFMTRVPEHLKPRVDQILVERGAKFEKRAYDIELRERDRYYINDVNEKTSDLVNRSMTNPESAYDNEVRGREIIRKAPLSQRAIIKAEKDFRELNAKYAIETSIRDAVANGDWAKHEEIVQSLRRVPKGTLPTKTEMSKGADAGDVLGRTYQFFLDKGLEPHQAAALAGNFRWESGGKADLVNPNDNLKNSPRSPHSIGIGQWNDRVPALIKFARENGVKVPEGDLRDVSYARQVAKVIPLATQLDFAWSELNSTETRAFNKIRSAKDLREATEGAISYHRPAGWTRRNPSAGHGFSNRLDFATQAGRLPTKAKAASEGDSDTYAVRDDSPRTDISGPTQLVKDEGKPAIDPETRLPSTDIGVTKSDLPQGAPKPADESGYDLVEDGEARGPSIYDSLSPRARHALLKMAREGGRTQVEQRVKDDIARLKNGYQEARDKDGRTALDRYRLVATDMQYQKAKRDVDAAKLEYQDLGALRQMTAEQQEEHISKISAQYADEDGYAKAEERRKKAQSLAEKISKERERDGAAAVMGLPNTVKVLNQIKLEIEGAEKKLPAVVMGPNGPVAQPETQGIKRSRLSPDQWSRLIEARLADQQEVMPDQPEKHRYISRAEAAQLLALPKKKITDNREYQDIMEKARAKAEATYGPKYAKAALKDAFDYFMSDEKHEFRRKEVLREMFSGEPLTRDVYERALRLEEVDNRRFFNMMGKIEQVERQPSFPTSDSLFNPPSNRGGPTNVRGADMVRMDDIGRPEPVKSSMPSASRPAIAEPTPPSTFPTERGLGSMVLQIVPRHAEWLRQNPDQWQVFDRKYGPGAAARVLGDPWGGKRDDLPKKR